MLAHFDNIPPARNNEEPLYGNLFEVTFEFPDVLGLTEDDRELMMISTKNITLDLTPTLGTVKQSFKYSGRLYLQTPTSENTTINDLQLEFYINVDDKFSMRTWNYMKKWYDLAWNSQTGALHYKREMIGSIVGHIHDRKGQVLRRVEFVNVQIKGIDGHQFSWDSTEIINGKATFCADTWYDSYMDIK